VRERGKKSNYVQQRRNTARLQEEQQKHDAHPAGVDRIADALETANNQEQSDYDKNIFREIITIVLLLVAVFLSSIANVIFYFTMKDARQAATDQLLALTGQLLEARKQTNEIHRQADAAARGYIFGSVTDNGTIYKWTFNQGRINSTINATNHGVAPAIIDSISSAAAWGTDDGPPSNFFVEIDADPGLVRKFPGGQIVDGSKGTSVECGAE